MDAGPHYTVFVKLPFPRESFEDPPPVQWDATKDQQLWKVISHASSSKELKWDELSKVFDAPLSFLLQQAAWLYERHFEGMKAQMKKLNVSAAPSPAPATPTLEGEASMKGPESKIPPAINIAKNVPSNRRDSIGSPATPTLSKPLISRTPSTNTVTQSRVFASQKLSSKHSFGSRIKHTEESYRDDDAGGSSTYHHERISEPESEDEPSRAPNRGAPKLQSNKFAQSEPLSSDADAEDEEGEGDSSGGFLPFATSSKVGKNESAATLRTSPRKQTGPSQQQATSSKSGAKPNSPPPPASSSVSSASSAAPHSRPSNTNNPKARTVGPLSPKHRAELEKLSPRQQHKKSGSEDSPSIGSSFSDLDDTSITQSALGEALLSNMQHGSIGMGSRISTLRDALGKRQ